MADVMAVPVPVEGLPASVGWWWLYRSAVGRPLILSLPVIGRRSPGRRGRVRSSSWLAVVHAAGRGRRGWLFGGLSLSGGGAIE